MTKERFYRNVHLGLWYPELESFCHLWAASVNNHGYGRFRVGGREFRAHRLAYEWAKGPIPEGLVLDHLCSTPACVNPDHLEAVSQRENMLRSEKTVSGRNARKTHCPQGHPYDEANTLRFPGGRLCRTCHAVHHRKASRKYKEKIRAQRT